MQALNLIATHSSNIKLSAQITPLGAGTFHPYCLYEERQFDLVVGYLNANFEYVSIHKFPYRSCWRTSSPVRIFLPCMKVVYVCQITQFAALAISVITRYFDKYFKACFGPYY
jgi:hypothetical protein